VLCAKELVLLKSALPPSQSLATAAQEGYVDAFFPTIAVKLWGVRSVNLRDDAFPDCSLK
jgi:hypothetical protein